MSSKALDKLMGLINREQSTVQLGAVTHKEILSLAEAHGVDPGEYRRFLLIRATEIAATEFRQAHGMSAQDYLSKGDGLNAEMIAPIVKKLATGNASEGDLLVMEDALGLQPGELIQEDVQCSKVRH